MKLLLLSNSTNYKEPYLGWCMDLIDQFLTINIKRILFLPYAGVKVAGKNYPEGYDAYTERVASIFKQHGFEVESIHEAFDPVEAVNQAEAIMVGGGNTCHLVPEIDYNGIIRIIKTLNDSGHLYNEKLNFITTNGAKNTVMELLKEI